MSELPKVSLGEFGIRGIRVTLERAKSRNAIAVLIDLDVARDVRGKDATMPLASTEYVDARAWEILGPKRRGEVIRSIVLNAVEHELDEWLRVDGERVVDPHEGEVVPVTIARQQPKEEG